MKCFLQRIDCQHCVSVLAVCDVIRLCVLTVIYLSTPCGFLSPRYVFLHASPVCSCSWMSANHGQTGCPIWLAREVDAPAVPARPLCRWLHGIYLPWPFIVLRSCDCRGRHACRCCTRCIITILPRWQARGVGFWEGGGGLIHLGLQSFGREYQHLISKVGKDRLGLQIFTWLSAVVVQ